MVCEEGKWWKDSVPPPKSSSRHPVYSISDTASNAVLFEAQRPQNDTEKAVVLHAVASTPPGIVYDFRIQEICFNKDTVMR